VLNLDRLERREIVPTGPMFGASMFQPAPGSPAADREQRILDEEQLRPESFARFGKLAEGTRRMLLARVEAPTVQQVGDTLQIAFSLPAGTYATVLLDEVMKPAENPPPRTAAASPEPASTSTEEVPADPPLDPPVDLATEPDDPTGGEGSGGGFAGPANAV